MVESFDITSAAVKTMGLALGGLSIAGMVKTADAATQMAARICNATANTEEYNQVQKRLFETANTTYWALYEAQEVYIAMSGV